MINNIWDIIICIAIAVLVVSALFIMHRNNKKGTSCCGCKGCARNGSCKNQSICPPQQKHDK